jgi:hypothetical protein
MVRKVKVTTYQVSEFGPWKPRRDRRWVGLIQCGGRKGPYHTTGWCVTEGAAEKKARGLARILGITLPDPVRIPMGRS